MARNQTTDQNTQYGVENGGVEGYATAAQVARRIVAASDASNLPAMDPTNGGAASDTQTALNNLAAAIQAGGPTTPDDQNLTSSDGTITLDPTTRADGTVDYNVRLTRVPPEDLVLLNDDNSTLASQSDGCNIQLLDRHGDPIVNFRNLNSPLNYRINRNLPIVNLDSADLAALPVGVLTEVSRQTVSFTNPSLCWSASLAMAIQHNSMTFRSFADDNIFEIQATLQDTTTARTSRVRFETRYRDPVGIYTAAYPPTYDHYTVAVAPAATYTAEIFIEILLNRPFNPTGAGNELISTGPRQVSSVMMIR